MSIVDLSPDKKKAELLLQMGQIQHIIRGKVTSQSFASKGHSQGPYFTLQRWVQGKNKSQRIPSNSLPMIQEAVSGYERFQQLAAQFINLVESQTWDSQSPEVKKKFHAFSK